MVKRKKIYKKNIKSLINTNLKLDNLKLNPLGMIDETKEKLSKFYINFKREKEK